MKINAIKDISIKQNLSKYYIVCVISFLLRGDVVSARTFGAIVACGEVRDPLN